MNGQIEKIVEQAIADRVFPGAVIGFIADAKPTILPFGHLTYDAGSPSVGNTTIYDIASLTKSVPTSSIILKLVEQGKLSLSDQAAKFLPEMNNPDKDKILIKHLLTSTVTFSLAQSSAAIAAQGGQAILDAIFTSPLLYPAGAKYHYSNAPAQLLGLIAEKITGKSLDGLADELFFKPLQMKNTTFNPQQLKNALIAPTEIDTRGEVCGQVHDEAAAALRQLGITAGHAGVFSTAPDLLAFAEMLLTGGEYRGRRYFSPETIRAMHTNQITGGGEGVGLGWEINQPQFMGAKVSKDCFGRTGFTGTVLLIDPLKTKALVLLSNRTYPQRPQSSDAINRFRRRLVDVVFA